MSFTPNIVSLPHIRLDAHGATVTRLRHRSVIVVPRAGDGVRLEIRDGDAVVAAEHLSPDAAAHLGRLLLGVSEEARRAGATVGPNAVGSP